MTLEQAARSFMQQQRDFLSASGERLIIDADTHLSDPEALPPEVRRRLEASADYYHGRPISREELLLEMDSAGVDMALCWQNPAVTPYGDDPAHNQRVLLAANRYIAASAREHPTRFIPAGWTDPKALGEEAAVELARRCIGELGFAIVKMNPAQNAYPIDSAMSLRVVDAIVAAGAIPAFHFGADTPYTRPEGFETVARRHPDWPVIGVHMGGGGASYGEAEETYQKARALGLRCPNVRFILSAKRDTHMESDFIAYQQAGEPFRRNLLCGSDAPYGKQTWNFGGFRAMLGSFLEGSTHPDARLRARPDLFDREAVSGYLGGNLARLLLQAYDRLLSA